MKKAIFISMVVVLLVFAVVYAAGNVTQSKLQTAKTKKGPTERQKCLDSCLVKFKDCRKPCLFGKPGVECKKACDKEKTSCLQKCPKSSKR